jgi:hypothetical protein
LYNLDIRPIYSVLLTVILAVMAYALFNWRQYVEHEEFMRRLNPFVTSLHLHERLLTNDTDSEQESRELFTALCRDALRTIMPALLFEGFDRRAARTPAHRLPLAAEQDTLQCASLMQSIGRGSTSITGRIPFGFTRRDRTVDPGSRLDGSEYNVQELQVARPAPSAFWMRWRANNWRVWW